MSKKITYERVIRILEQTDTALGCAGLKTDDIFRVELQQVKQYIKSHMSEFNKSDATCDDQPIAWLEILTHQNDTISYSYSGRNPGIANDPGILYQKIVPLYNKANAEDQFERYVAALIEKAPNVQRIGELLANWLDDDKFNTIEPMLLGLAREAATPSSNQ